MKKKIYLSIFATLIFLSLIYVANIIHTLFGNLKLYIALGVSDIYQTYIAFFGKLIPINDVALIVVQFIIHFVIFVVLCLFLVWCILSIIQTFKHSVMTNEKAQRIRQKRIEHKNLKISKLEAKLNKMKEDE